MRPLAAAQLTFRQSLQLLLKQCNLPAFHHELQLRAREGCKGFLVAAAQLGVVADDIFHAQNALLTQTLKRHA